MTIRKADMRDVDAVTRLGLLLWEDHPYDELRGEFADILADAAQYIAIWEQNGQPAAFAPLRTKARETRFRAVARSA